MSDIYSVVQKNKQIFFFLCVVAIVLLVIFLNKTDKRSASKKRTHENKKANALFRAEINRPLFLAYDGTWTKGKTDTYNPSGIAITTNPYSKLDVLIISFSDLRFYGSGATMLLGGINGPSQTLRDASLMLPIQRLKAFSASNEFNVEDGVDNDITDNFANHDDFTNYLNACKTAHPNLEIWLGMGGASACDKNSAAVWAAITEQNIRDIFVAYPALDGIHLDIENTTINPQVFLSQCEMMANAMPTGKQFTLCIEILQACAESNFSQYAALWKSNPAELFDYVSVQFYNYGYPTDPTAEPSANNPTGGDLPALEKYGFNKNQIILGINPGPDQIAGPNNLPWISNIANTTQALNYLKTNGYAGVALWSIQRDSPRGNAGDTTVIPVNNYTFDFQRSPQDGKTPELGWNAPWPSQYTNVVSPGTADGAFGNLVTSLFTIT